MNTLVRISDIGQYLRCPRLVYLDSLGRLSRKSAAKHILLRNLMLSLMERNDLEGQLTETLKRLKVELPLVYDLQPAELEAAIRDIEGDIGSIARGLEGQIDQILPFEAEVELYSERLGLSGRLDRLAPGNTPSLIRTGRPPENGVWKSDRLILAGYSLLLGERDTKANSGQVEYPIQGIYRRVQIHSADKARVLRIRDRIRHIKNGQLPDRPDYAACQSCHSREICETKHSLASKFF